MNYNEHETCPWCGHHISNIHHLSPGTWFITCHGCGYKTQKYESWSDARKEYDQAKKEKLEHDKNNNIQ